MAQAVVTRYLELLGEPEFHEASYGVCPGRSAPGAVAKTPQRIKNMWLLSEIEKGSLE